LRRANNDGSNSKISNVSAPNNDMERGSDVDPQAQVLMSAMAKITSHEL